MLKLLLSGNLTEIREASMQVQSEIRYYTPEEYCLLEETAEYKNEYLDGEIIPMTEIGRAHV